MKFQVFIENGIGCSLSICRNFQLLLFKLGEVVIEGMNTGGTKENNHIVIVYFNLR